ncbi:MAG: hypothetical protein J5887_00540 [Erysipelotrichaceae bacterium]|nr:hypothetical protein [Erysipelotrichaceae bacterium]
MNKPSLKDRFTYWFDNQMSRGSVGLVRILLIFTILVVLLISAIIFSCGFSEDQGFFGIVWDSLTTIINAWMPSFEEGSVGYVCMMALAAFVGLLVTSVLIGIFSSAIEEKIVGLRKGNSLVIEKDHIVLIGFYSGEYTLLRQLVLAAQDDPCTIVVGAEMERDELEEAVSDNIEKPDNVRIICRTIDPLDPVSLEKLAIASCRSVIISPTDDDKTVKILLALISLMDSNEIADVRINAVITKDENRFPALLAEKHNIMALHFSDARGKLIAHSCNQPGLSRVFRDIFDYEGSELYIIHDFANTGLTFENLLVRMDGGVPVGVVHDGQLIMNPESDMILQNTDQLLVYAESQASCSLISADQMQTPKPKKIRSRQNDRASKTTIFGNRRSLSVILSELPDTVSRIALVNYDKFNYETVQKICARRGFDLELVNGDAHDENFLYETVKDSEHIIIQSNYGNEEESDMNTIFLLLNLREIREKHDLKFNITAEMRREKNQVLVDNGDSTDFIVASNMSSLLLAQLSENPGLLPAFREILSNEGNELFMKRASEVNCVGTFTISQLRQLLFEQGCILLGIMNSRGYYLLNPPLKNTVELTASDSVIVFAED